MKQKFKREAYGMKLTLVENPAGMIPPQGFSAINLYPFPTYTRMSNSMKRISDNTIRHEMIHTMQAKEMLILPYYLWYFLEWLVKLLVVVITRRKGDNVAYKSISFEQEAYYNSENLNYGKERKWYGWIKYVFKMYN